MNKKKSSSTGYVHIHIQGGSHHRDIPMEISSKILFLRRFSTEGHNWKLRKRNKHSQSDLYFHPLTDWKN